MQRRSETDTRNEINQDRQDIDDPRDDIPLEAYIGFAQNAEYDERGEIPGENDDNEGNLVIDEDAEIEEIPNEGQDQPPIVQQQAEENGDNIAQGEAENIPNEGQEQQPNNQQQVGEPGFDGQDGPVNLANDGEELNEGLNQNNSSGSSENSSENNSIRFGEPIHRRTKRMKERTRDRPTGNRYRGKNNITNQTKK